MIGQNGSVLCVECTFSFAIYINCIGVIQWSRVPGVLRNSFYHHSRIVGLFGTWPAIWNLKASFCRSFEKWIRSCSTANCKYNALWHDSVINIIQIWNRYILNWSHSIAVGLDFCTMCFRDLSFVVWGGCTLYSPSGKSRFHLTTNQTHDCWTQLS